jgi:hypothetical protein
VTKVRASLALLVLALVAVVPIPASAEVRIGEDVFPFGDAGFHGSTGNVPLNAPLVGMAATASGRGYWLLARDGGIFSYGDARFHGSTGDRRLNRPVTGLAAHPEDRGYWFVAEDGGVFAFDVPFHGSMGGRPLARPVVGMAPTRSGRGYWLVASDGGIFSFGDAAFAGSTGDLRLARPIVDMAADPDGRGYWLLAADGGIFSFGATFHGSAVTALPSGDRATGIAAHPGGGYWITSERGGVYAFGAARFHGAGHDGRPVVDVVPTPSGNGYWLAVARAQGLSEQSQLRFDGIGGVRVGMTLAQASAAIGRPITIDPNSAPEPSVCAFAYPRGGPPGVAFMVYDGRIQRVDVFRSEVPTVAGVRVGFSEAQVRAAYPGLRNEPSIYDPAGRNLIVDEPGPYRLLFETHNGVVRTFRSGVDDAVDAPEGCA